MSGTGWRRLVRLWHADGDAEIEDEITFHLISREDEARAHGASPADARREATQAFGDRRRIEAELRQIGARRRRRQRSASFIDDCRTDLVHSLRTFVRRPVVPAIVVVTLALAIGSATAVFTLFDHVVLRPLPLAQAEQLYVIRTAGARPGPLPYPAVQALRETAQGWEDLAAAGDMTVTVRAGAYSDQVNAALVTGNYFGTLGMQPQLGRLIQDADDGERGAAPNVVLSDVLWRRAFGSDRDVVGRTLHINSQPFTVIGVAPRSFRGLDLSATAELWLPITMVRLIGAGGIFAAQNVLEVETLHWMTLVGRVSASVAPEASIAELSERHMARQRALPATPSPVREREVVPLAATPVQDAATGAGRTDVLRFVSILWVVVGLCVLLACANVANLLLLRAADRWRELGMRMAIGAGRVRIFRQVLIESLLLAVTAGALGLAVALLGMRLLSTFSLPGDIAIADAGLAIDARVFAFAAALAGMTAIAFGLAPAIWASRPALMDAVRGMSTGGAGGRWRGGAPLIAVQAAISILLVVGALLFVRSLQSGLTRDLGFRTNGVVAVTMHLQQSGYNNERGRAALGEVMRILQDRPTIHSSAIAAFVPPGAVGLRLPVAAQETKRAAAGGRLFVNPVSANYFDVLGIPIASGRQFTDADEVMDSEAVAIVSEETARQLWPDEDAIGRRLNLFPGLVEDSWRVVGVVRDGEFGTLGVITPSVFLPFAHFAGSVEVSLLVHGAGPPAVTLGIVRDAIRQVDDDLPVFNARALDAQLADVLMPQRFGSALLVAFGVIAVLISAVGMYATVAYDVTRRRRELAIRAALGAGRRELVTAVLSRAAAAVIAGMVVGLGAAAALTGGLRAFLFGITPHEPVSFGLAPIILGVAAAVATGLPLRHAQRADPMQTLRE